ncbi:hypothetical protein EDB89DRAFT_841255 [Lactarius sanguifluus]|nr:hypothetical protein EDB89DRAFT_841255 [Lactarius sanguifluus]
MDSVAPRLSLPWRFYEGVVPLRGGSFRRSSACTNSAGLMLLMVVLYTGYTIPKPLMIGALKWISDIDVSE